MRKILLGVALGFWAIALSAMAFAADYPNRPVRVVVGFSAGSGVDVLARVVAQKLSDTMGQAFVIENRPGAGSNIGTRYAASAGPDGYTLFVATVANAINATLYRNLEFDFLKDFSPIILAGTAPNFLVVKPSLPAQTVADFIQLAKSKPKTLTLGSSGNGTVVQMAGAMFRKRSNADLVPVPFKGGPEATSALLGGQIDSLFAISSTVLPHISAGTLRALAVTSRERSAVLPQIPTLNESGMPGFEAVTWFGFTAPTGTPRDIIDLLNAEIGKILAMPDVRETLAKQGIDVARGTPDQFATYMQAEFPKWKELVLDSGATIQD
ncbi:MAG TPA: tripartite tricarboxylate transporter substrate binding protein [Xanthobacteraceae bacterium]|jgi:tripartite-type tricarboxylate transporter receptor subunit TctC|nr:tripartite tricarboxylate transporter substrate binding protein [Xanthobacteraceae bacterium]